MHASADGMSGIGEIFDTNRRKPLVLSAQLAARNHTNIPGFAFALLIDLSERHRCRSAVLRASRTSVADRQLRWEAYEKELKAVRRALCPQRK